MTAGPDTDAVPAPELPNGRSRPGSREERGQISRRQLLGGIGTLGAGAVFAIGAAGCDTAPAPSPRADQGDDVVDFYSVPHQPGIVHPDPPQDHLVFASMNVTTSSRAELSDLLRNWTVAAARMARGAPLPGGIAGDTQFPADSGEALDRTSGKLTLTIGYGPSLFDERFGLGSKQPAPLVELPPLELENLDPAYTGGDIAIQACSNDAQVAFHAVRDLLRMGDGVVAPAWVERGFSRSVTTLSPDVTTRNLIGFKDGTKNIGPDQIDLQNDYIWVGDEADQPWMKGGTYMVVRRIRIFLEEWDLNNLDEQQKIIGRFKANGAPLTGTGEFDVPDYDATDRSGSYVIPLNAHIRLAARAESAGFRIQRRGYNFADGLDPSSGQIFGGTFFIAFMKNPVQFIDIQETLAAEDALSPFISHVGSALFACPPGMPDGEFWGQRILQ